MLPYTEETYNLNSSFHFAINTEKIQTTWYFLIVKNTISLFNATHHIDKKWKICSNMCIHIPEIIKMRSLLCRIFNLIHFLVSKL
jgi:hypothetical protein